MVTPLLPGSSVGASLLCRRRNVSQLEWVHHTAFLTCVGLRAWWVTILIPYEGSAQSQARVAQPGLSVPLPTRSCALGTALGCV